MNTLRKCRPLVAIFTAVFATMTMLGSSAFASESPSSGAEQNPTVYIQTSDGVVTPTSVDNCSKSAVTGGSKYSNCKIYVWVGVWSMSFEADFTIKTSGYDSINAVRNRAWSWGGPVSQDSSSLVIGQATENASGPAWARYTGVFSGPLIGTKTQWVGLWVGGNSYGENHSGG